MRILPLRKDAPELGAAAAAFEANRRRASVLVIELAEKTELQTRVRAALTAAQAKAAAPASLRERIQLLEAEMEAAHELNSTLSDAAPLAALREQLVDAERELTDAAHRARVEAKKLQEIDKQIDQLRAAQRAVQGQHVALAVEALWEVHSTKAAALTAARAAFLEEFDDAFATARAIDRVAEETKTGRFAGSGGARELVLPILAGMDELPYTTAEHLTKIDSAAISILKGLGLHS